MGEGNSWNIQSKQMTDGFVSNVSTAASSDI